MANKDYISDELLAAYLDGNTNAEETKQVLDALKTDKQLQEVLHIALQVENDVSLMPSLSEEHQNIKHKAKAQQCKAQQNKARTH